MSSLSNEDQAEFVARKFLDSSAYYKTMSNPFAESSHPARAPTDAPEKTTVVQVKFTVPLWSNSNGDACIFMRPSIQYCHAVSNKPDTVLPPATSIFDPAYADAEVLFDAYNVSSAQEGAAPWLQDAWCISPLGLQPIPNFERYITSFTDYRVTAAGYTFAWTDKILDLSGSAYTALMPGAYGVPYWKNATYNLKPSSGASSAVGRLVELTGSEGVEVGGPRTENIEPLEDGEVISLVKNSGFCQYWAPKSEEAMLSWRPTRYMPAGARCEAMNQISDAEPAGAGNTYWYFPASCPGDPERFKAFYDEQCGKNHLLTGATSLAVGGGLTENFIDIGGETISGIYSNVSTSIQERWEYFNMTIAGEGESTMMSLLTGCPVSQLIGNVTFVMNIECLDEQRSFRLSNSSVSHSLELARKSSMLAIEAVKKSAPAPPGTEEHTAHHEEQHENAVSSVGDFVKDVIETGTEIYDAVAPVVEFAMDAIPFIAALF